MPGRRLYRSSSDRKIAGVCGGIAEYFDIDPVFVRIAALVLTIPHGLGLIAYIVCWVAVPQRPEGAGSPAGDAAAGSPSAGDPGPEPGLAAGGPSVVRSAAPGNGQLLGGGALIVAGLFFLMLNLGILDWELFRFWRWRVIWPLVVIALGIYIVSTSLKLRQDSAGKGRL